MASHWETAGCPDAWPYLPGSVREVRRSWRPHRARCWCTGGTGRCPSAGSLPAQTSGRWTSFDPLCCGKEASCRVSAPAACRHDLVCPSSRRLSKARSSDGVKTSWKWSLPFPCLWSFTQFLSLNNGQGIKMGAFPLAFSFLIPNRTTMCRDVFTEKSSLDTWWAGVRHSDWDKNSRVYRPWSLLRSACRKQKPRVWAQPWNPRYY